ncbi:MAG: DUF4118 domain-containing protein [Firmicutes bacterium]|nr:DUF4118 domain-containing protein [Bacillota bacterium]
MEDHINIKKGKSANRPAAPTQEELVRSHKKDTMISLGVFFVVTIASFFFNELASDPMLNIAMLYTLGVFIITRYTSGYIYGLMFAVFSVLSVNFFFTYPYQDFNFSLEGYQVTFLGMFIIGILTSTMSSNMKEQSRKLLEQEKALAEQEKALMEAEKEKMRANLLRAVSHDLRTPLTGIIGNSSTYLEMEHRLSNGEKRALMEYINNDANWLLNMVENLLSVTRIDNDTASVSKSLEPVDEVVAAAVIQFKKRFPEAEVHVTVPESEPDDVMMVMMDAMLIQQVILNILQNAQLHSGSTKPLELTIDEDEDNVMVSIRDYGVGIDGDRINDIFDGAGFKKGESYTDGYKGMGIGLSICKTIIMAHNGQISARNCEEGAEFSFSLPKEIEE